MAKRKGKNNSKAQACRFDNINFKSKLEMYCYKALKREGVPATYEKRPLQILEGFKDFAPLFKSHGGNSVKEKTSKVQGVVYTPDFEDDLDNPHWGFFIEVKGRRNEAFPMRLKLFRLWRTKNQINKDYYEVCNEKEVEEAISLIKQNL